jgi:hypothetical protein
MAQLSPDQLTQYTQAIQQNPQLAQIYREWQQAIQSGNGRYSDHVYLPRLKQELARMGITLPEDYSLHMGHNGQLEIQQAGFFSRNPWVPAAMISAPAAFLAAPGAAAGSAASGASGGTGAASQALGMQGLAPGAAASGSGATAATAAGAGTPWWQTLLGGADGMGATDWIRTGLAGASLIGGALTDRDEPDLSPELRRLYQLQADRLASQNPLYESVTQLAFNRLPGSATQGMQAPSLASAESMVPQVSGGNYSEADELRNMLRQQEVRQQVQTPLYQAITRLAGNRLPGRRA